MEDDFSSVGVRVSRLGRWLDQVEAGYLRLLRVLILAIATGLVLYAAWLAASGFYHANRSIDEVVVQTAQVSPEDLARTGAVSVASHQTVSGDRGSHRSERKFYDGYLGRLYSVFKNKFELYRQAEDKQLSRDEFDGAFLHTAQRIVQVDKGEINFEQDRVDLESFLTTIQKAAGLPETVSRLQNYRRAKKIEVATSIDRIRQEMRSSWDSTSTACESWELEPVGCRVTQMVDVPYVETIKELRFPEGTQSYVQLYRELQDKYYALLSARRAAAQRTAEDERNAILLDNALGLSSLSMAVKVVGAFIVLMFFFLLIAIERHQRRASVGKV